MDARLFESDLLTDIDAMGVLLSSGVDSSIIVTMAAAEIDRQAIANCTRLQSILKARAVPTMIENLLLLLPVDSKLFIIMFLSQWMM